MLTSLKKRMGWYVAAQSPQIPAPVSTVHAKNRSLMHVLAAEQIEDPKVNGQAFFCRDFEANVVKMNVAVFRRILDQVSHDPPVARNVYGLAVREDRAPPYLALCFVLEGARYTTRCH